MADERGRRMSVVVMGPSGVGKTTTAKGIAERLGWLFAEADEFHPPANIEKMRNGIPLDDTDRAPWLAKIGDWISARAAEDTDTVLTCSALRKRYRDVLREADADVRFVELTASVELVGERVAKRKGHYMPPSLLGSQYATLESLAAGEPGIRVAVDVPPEIVVERALRGLDLTSKG